MDTKQEQTQLRIELAFAYSLRRIGAFAAYYAIMRSIAKDALIAANKSNCPKRRAAAMRALNHFSKRAYIASLAA